MTHSMTVRRESRGWRMRVRALRRDAKPTFTLPGWRSRPVVVLALTLVALLTSGCETLIGGDFGQRFKLAKPDSGVGPGPTLESCGDRNCGSFEADGVTVYCGSCPSEQVCVENKCTCNPQTCQALGAECGYRSNGCNRPQYCGSCERNYPNDPSKAFCHDDGKCGDETGLAKTCEDVRAQGRAAECGDVGVGETLLSCGECQGRELCSNNECSGYAPLKCEEITGGGLLCGSFPDGNGGAITCGCGNGEVCAPGGVCCTARAECPANSCGTMPDGCGGTIDCGGCEKGEVCSGNVCCTDDPQCPAGVCGEIKICGRTLLCGECAGQQCCVKDAQGMGRCHTPSCPANGLCGDDMPNGCGTGGTIDACGCPDGLSCNQGRCECIPKTCPADGTTCGQIDDGCGGFLTCGCTDGRTCVDGMCCSPSCPDGGACGLQPDGCGGLIACNTCGEGEVCNDGACMTPSCPDNAVCGSNETNGVVLTCLGTCSNGQPCSAQNGVYTCGDCTATCPASGSCGLTDLGCTTASCPGVCGVDGQVCVNRGQQGNPDNYQCCSARCPVAQSIACGAYQDPSCPGTATSCQGSCPEGESCIATNGVYACKQLTCPDNARCGSNEVDGVAIQCPGTCTKPNDMCIKDGATYSCICSPNEDPCGDTCGTTAQDGCSAQPVTCSCSGTDTCIGGTCCSPLSAQAACLAAGAQCGVVQEPNCGVDRACSTCADDQTCVANQCVCDQTKCAANETCDAASGRCVCDSTKCPAGQECNAQGACTCDDDQCPEGRVCNSSGLCACPQTNLEACEAALAECGVVTNECDEEVTCSTCAEGWECQGNTCVCAETLEETCSAFECADMVMNSCRQMVDCSTVVPCDPGYACSQGTCVCVQNPQTACDNANAQCGTVENSCGQVVSCPECSAGKTCDTDNNECLCSETPAQACARVGVPCGDVEDACGDTVPCPNTCTGLKVCIGDACVCPQTDAEACENADCGTVTNQCGDTVECPDLCNEALEECTPGGTVCRCLQSDAEACGTVECGTVLNNCEEPVPCGECDIELNEVCIPETGQCDCRDPGACANRVCGTVIDACNEEIECGDPCQPGSACNDAGTGCEPL